jgi:hypothetical protein
MTFELQTTMQHNGEECPAFVQYEKDGDNVNIVAIFRETDRAERFWLRSPETVEVDITTEMEAEYKKIITVGNSSME